MRATADPAAQYAILRRPAQAPGVLDDDAALLLAFSLMPFVRPLLIAVAAAFVLAACTTVSPPIQEMTDARLAIIAASDAQAQTYAPDRLVEAQLLLKSAQDNLERRAYSAARRDANLAKASSRSSSGAVPSQPRRQRWRNFSSTLLE